MFNFPFYIFSRFPRFSLVHCLIVDRLVISIRIESDESRINNCNLNNNCNFS